METVRRILIRLAATLALGGGVIWATQAPAATSYYYTFTFDALGTLYPDNSIQVKSPFLLTSFGDTASSNIIGSLNGFVPTSIGVLAAGGGYAYSFGSLPQASGFEPVNSIAGFYWGSSNPIVGPGVYHTDDGAGRVFSSGTGGFSVVYTGGYLFVTPETTGGGDPEPPAPTGVPEPTTLALLGGGLGLVGMLRRRRSRDATAE